MGTNFGNRRKTISCLQKALSFLPQENELEIWPAEWMNLTDHYSTGRPGKFFQWVSFMKFQQTLRETMTRFRSKWFLR